MVLKVIFLILIIFFNIKDSYAEETHTLACRPTIACTAEIVSLGNLELESGVLLQKSGLSSKIYFPFLDKYTLTEYIQLQLGGNYYTNIYPGVKFHLISQNNLIPSISFSTGFNFPIYNSYYNTDLILYISKNINNIIVDFNLGLNIYNNFSQEWVALSLSKEIVNNFGIMAENYYFTDISPISKKDSGLLSAVYYSPKKYLTFDMGNQISYFPSNYSYCLFTGITVIPTVFW
jgi:hypothetical protein